MEKLSNNFTREELACKGKDCCGGSAPVDGSLVEGLQALRELVGMPLTLTCGFRCRTHNKEVGGAENSYHIKGMAADIEYPFGYNQDMFIGLAKTVKLFGGIGIYPWGIHVDVREGCARWNG